MIKIIESIGNLLDVKKGHIIHGCNAQGIMGSGVALAIKNKYPSVFKSYRSIYLDGDLRLGRAYPVRIKNDLIIWNAITQEDFGQAGRNCSYDAIQTCFKQINDIIKFENISSIQMNNIPQEIHIPQIGAGLGGGNWEIIKTIIEQTVSYPTTVWILPK